jgi:Ca-activated chloride channel family protein
MVDKIEDVQDAVLHFSKTVNPQDEIFVIRFSSEVDFVLDFTSDRSRLERVVRRLRAHGSTQLYDAIAEGLEIVRQGRYQKKALLIVTDGNDTASSAKLEEALQFAQKSEVLIYALGIGHSERGSFAHLPAEFRDEVDMKVLNAFAEATGGKSYHLEAAHRGGIDLIDQACLEVSAELRQQYMLAYYPTNKTKDGSYRRIRVETRNPDHVVRTRRGYFAPRAKK